MEATHIVVIVLVVIATVFLVLFERSSRKNAPTKSTSGPGATGPGASGKA